ncbi:MAG: FumA C-terminus/TtdB family hydratase beta subunit [Actinobacteria bacterium]|nr:FumA C-terminus/TtdB family hydratase beta subunit [Actinomycetota bacterium]
MSGNTYRLSTPLTEEKIRKLKAGDTVYLSGIILGARDAAHKRIVEAIRYHKKLPFDLKNKTVFYVGPSPTPPGKKSGSIGPTTSARMDNLTEPLLKAGLKAMIGKGRRSDKIKELLKKYKSIYLVSAGGISAYLSTKVKDIKIIAYGDLGAEAVHEILVKDLPLFVAYDIYGGDIFESALLVE